ncbi:MAG: hypothetical protein IPN74_09810 [Haliscomenobacter sp.]|nr:hypothetical protein [Haliscomenobacter sp.]MBK8878821.1 hypothetical protein [Haliscomenobacter sp.]
MKKAAVLFLLALSSSFAFTQDCDAFYAVKKGVKLGYSYFDAKDKLTSSSETVVTDVKSVGNAVEAQMSITMKDKNNKPTFEGASKVVCKEDAVYLDITNLLGPQTQAFGKMEVSLSGDGVVLPNNLKAGQKLADSHNEIKLGMNGTPIMTMTFDIREYTVEAEEKVTTPAGTFDCFRTSYQMSSKTLLVNTTVKVVQWFAKGVGMVKSETFDKKGNLDSWMVLQAFTK